jgi:hypothetical protein
VGKSHGFVAVMVKDVYLLNKSGHKSRFECLWIPADA